MIMKVYTVADKAVGAFLPPFYVRSAGEALRSFADACSKADSNFHKYPMDYTLMELGEFDDASGVFACHEPIRVISAFECMVPDEAPTEPVSRLRSAL